LTVQEVKPTSEDQLKRLRPIAELIRQLWRAAHGMEIDAKDILAFLVNAEDVRERTRLKEHDVYGHSAMEFLADIFPGEFGFMKELAKLENIYFIPLDGEQRKEMILMQRAKGLETNPQQQSLSITMPETTPQPPQPQQQQQQKKGLFHR